MRPANFKLVLCVSLLLSFQNRAIAQEVWQPQKAGVNSSLRGLCVVDKDVVWASGSEGTVIRTDDGGATWNTLSVPAAATLDFRDIHAFNSQRAVIMSAGQPARIYLTEDGGRSWKQTFEHPNKKAFFDAISFWDKQHGIAMSDPVDERILLIETRNGGQSWSELEPTRRPEALRGEGGFAASGTNMIVFGDKCFIGLGSAEADQSEPDSRIVYSLDRGNTWAATKVPLTRNQSSGIFSIAFADDKNGIVVGGDYLKQDNDASNIATTRDGGLTWQRPDGKPPRGYRSAVAYFRDGNAKDLIAVGPAGTDISNDGGINWVAVSEIGFHAVAFTRDGNSGWASGSEGRIARWSGKKVP